MKNIIWLEFIGIWGTGKSTLINKLKKDLKKYDIYIETSSSYSKLKKDLKFLFLFVNFLKTFKISIYISYLLIKHFMYLKVIKKNNLGKDLIKTFFLSYQARIFSLFNSKKNHFLWEGEFHLIPFLELEFAEKEKLVNLLFEITKTKNLRFVFLNIPFNKTIKNIELDQRTKKNMRFSIEELKIYKKYQANALEHQKELIEILKKKDFFIYIMDEKLTNYNFLFKDILKTQN